MIWTAMTIDERADACRKMAEVAGLTSTRIADLLGTTRHAIGKFCRRQKIKLPGSLGNTRGSAPSTVEIAGRQVAPQVMIRAREIPLSPQAVPVNLFDRDWTACRRPLWTADDPIEDKLYCGAKRKSGSSYCPSCHAVLFIPYRRVA